MSDVASSGEISLGRSGSAPWLATAPVPDPWGVGPAEARSIGLNVGSLIGLLIGAAASPWALASASADFTVVGPPLSLVPLAIVIAGGMGGAVMGPRARQATASRGWPSVVVGLALLAVVIGAIVEGEGMAVIAFANSSAPGAELSATFLIDSPTLSMAIVGFFGIQFAAWGILLLGLPVLPFAVAASIAWAVVVRAAFRGQQSLARVK